MNQSESSRQAALTEHNYSKRSTETQSALMTGWEMLAEPETVGHGQTETQLPVVTELFKPETLHFNTCLLFMRRADEPVLL